MPFLFENNCTKRKSLHLLRHPCPELNQMFMRCVILLPFQNAAKGYIYKEAFPGLVYCQHFFSFSFLTVSKEVVLIAPMMASRDVIFPNCWFCLAEWSRLSIVILDNFALNVQTHKAIRRISEEIPPAAGFPVRAEPDLRTVQQQMPSRSQFQNTLPSVVLFNLRDLCCSVTSQVQSELLATSLLVLVLRWTLGMRKGQDTLLLLGSVSPPEVTSLYFCRMLFPFIDQFISMWQIPTDS